MKSVGRTLNKYLVPHEGNDHKPHLLRIRSIVFVLIIALAVESAFVLGTSTLAPRSKLFGIILTNALVDETNQSRTTDATPVSALTISPLLEAAAQDKANDMVANNYFAHTSPSGLTPWYWFSQVGYNFIYAGENLAVNFSDSQDVTDAWMNSPEHRANILNANYTQIGIATATGTYEGHPAVYVVELFGTPVPPAPPAEPIAFVNSAAAANLPGSSAATATATATATLPKTKPAPAIKQMGAGTVATVLPATATSEVSVFVATATAMATAIKTTTTAPVLSNAALINITPQSNPIQEAAANPRQVVDDIYLAIIALFALALAINVFVKVRVQHPQIILGGMFVILVVGLFIVLNQHGLAATAVL